MAAELTPEMLLKNLFDSGKADLNLMDGKSLNEGLKRAPKNKEKMKNGSEKKSSNVKKEKSRPKNGSEVDNGDIILVASDPEKTMHLPLARVLIQYRGADGVSHVAKVKVNEKGELPKPLQKLFPMEKSQSEEDSLEGEWSDVDNETNSDPVGPKKEDNEETGKQGKLSKRGRKIKIPKRYK